MKLSKAPATPQQPAFNSEIVSWPICGQKEEALLLEAFRTGNWWYGERVREFEQKFADYQGARYGITCSNGTIALEIALRALGIGPGDEVIVPDYTFIATASAVASLGAIPRFADVDPDTANINLEHAETLVTEFTRAIIVVHFAGLPVDMEKARQFADKHDLKLLEDAAHGWGSQWNGKGVGAIGDAGTFSFQVSKNITSGEGGIVITNDEETAKILRSQTNCGRFENAEWYEHSLLAGNHRLTELQAAILIGQFSRLPKQVELREKNAAYLDKELARIPGIRVPSRPDAVTRRSYHLYLLNYQAEEFGAGLSKAKFVKALNQEGLPATGGYLWPTHANKSFTTLNDSPRPEHRWLSDRCNERGIRYDAIQNPVASRLCEETLIWLPHTLLLGDQKAVEQVVEAIRKVQKITC